MKDRSRAVCFSSDGDGDERQRRWKKRRRPTLPNDCSANSPASGASPASVPEDEELGINDDGADDGQILALHSVAASERHGASAVAPASDCTAYRKRLREYQERHGDARSQDCDECHRVAGTKAKSAVHGDDTAPELTREERKLVQLLAAQAYHLPGNSSYQDWVQYVWDNNHPVVGICRHHRLHPLQTCSRIFTLLGLCLFGLILTNLVYLASTTEDFAYFNDPIVTVVLGDTNITEQAETNHNDPSYVEMPSYSTSSAYAVTVGMVLLWTIGSVFHTVFSLAIWQLAACACCRSGGCFERCACCPSLGKRLVRIIVMVLALLAAAIVLTRASTSADPEDDFVVVVINGNTDNPGNKTDSTIAYDDFVQDRRNFQFLVGYSVEFILTMFVYYPIGATLLFSGIFGCGRLPLLGGRPRDIWLIQQRQERQRRRQERRDQRMRHRKPLAKERANAGSFRTLPTASTTTVSGDRRALTFVPERIDVPSRK